MLRTKLLAAVAAAALVAATAMPAQAISIMYNGDFATLVEPGIAAYEAETGETVEAIKLPGEGYQDRIQLDLAAGTAADLVMVDSFVVSELAGAGYLQSLGTSLQGWDQFQYYMKGLLDVVSYNGEVYALPTDTDVRMLWYNRAAFEKAGLPQDWAPKSWDDVLAAAAKLKEAGVENAWVIPAGTKQGEAATMQGFYMALLGADVPEGDRNRLRVRADDKWIGDSPAIRRTLQLYQDVYVNQALTPGAVNYTADFATTNQLLLDGKIGILASGSWQNVCLWGCGNADQPTQEEKNALVGWTPWPGSGLPGTNATTNISGGWTIAVNAKSADAEASFKLLTTIFDVANFGKWSADNRRMAVRTDISESEAYASDAFLAQATSLAAETTGRDTVPGYQKVSALVQQMTGEILDGRSVDDVVQEYHDALVDEFGEENVVTFE